MAEMSGDRRPAPRRGQAYKKTLVKLEAEMQELVVMDADLSGSTKTGEFKKIYPNRFFNAGIAEQNLYGMAAGLSLSGKTVCASTFESDFF